VLTFTVYGVAQPKGSHRAFLPPGMKFPIVTDSNRSARSWSQLVAHAATTALDAQSRPRLEVGPMRVSLSVFLPRPKKFQTPKWRTRTPPHLTAPDLDKLTRCILDALTRVVWQDDAQVVELVAVKRYTERDDPPHVDIRVEPTSGVHALYAQPVTIPLFEGGLL
jgi:crossover junction endodeoxyribonuclease RusA